MEHRCHRCAANIKPGTPFCKQCGAPQIRVPVIEGEDIADRKDAAPWEPLEPAQADSDASGDRRPLWMPSPPSEHPSEAIDWSRALPGIAWAALLEAALTFFGLGLVAGGFLSVLFYRRGRRQEAISPAMGAKLGVVSGGLGFCTVAIIRSVEILFFNAGSEMHDAILRSLEEAARHNPPPQAEQVIEYLKSPDGFAVVLALVLLVSLIFFLILSSLGGVIGASTLRKRNPT